MERSDYPCRVYTPMEARRKAGGFPEESLTNLFQRCPVRSRSRCACLDYTDRDCRQHKLLAKCHACFRLRSRLTNGNSSQVSFDTIGSELQAVDAKDLL